MITLAINPQHYETLTWDEQVTLITKKVNKGLNVMRRLRDFFDIKILTTVYQTLVQPYFDYCSQVWGGLGTTLCNKLQRLQNRAVRIITKSGYEVRSVNLLHQLGLPNLEEPGIIYQVKLKILKL